MTDEKPLRLFVAIELPEAWTEALGELQQRMKAALASHADTAGMRLRWVRPEGIHLTLKFIGEVEPGRVPVLEEQLSRAVTEKPGMVLTPARAGAFADARAPRVIWVGVQSDPAQSLLPLAESIETWLAAAEVPRDRRSFRPHLTLARLPTELTAAQRERAAELTTAVALPAMPPFVVERVSLMRSQLGPGGARYERLQSWPG